jgi:hypothetical protein
MPACATRQHSGIGCPSCQPSWLVEDGDQHTLTAMSDGVRLGWQWGEAVVLVGEGSIVIFCTRFVERAGAFTDVVLGRVMLCVIVSAVSGSATPIDIELALSNAVADPVVAHVHRL